MAENKIISCPHCNKKVRIPAGKYIEFTCPQCGEDLEFNDVTYAQVKEPEDNYTFGDMIIDFLLLTLAFPLFIIAHNLLPNLDWNFHLDRILLGLLILFAVKLLLNSYRVLVIIGFISALIWLGYGTYKGEYGFIQIYKDYRMLVHEMMHSPHPERVIITDIHLIKNKKAIIDAIDYENPVVRNYALSLTQEFKYVAEEYDEYRQLIQSFAVFKEINSKWNYVNDPVSREYFAKASESIQHLSGDCDDHSILMAACIKAIGGTARLVVTNGHIYPEIYIGDSKDLSTINYLIKKSLFRYESRGHELKYHIDDEDDIWLNLDYTAKYPGGPFLNEEVINIIDLVE